MKLVANTESTYRAVVRNFAVHLNERCERDGSYLDEIISKK